MSLVSEFDQTTRERRAQDMMAGIYRYMRAFEESDPRVVELAAPDLLELKGRIDRLVRKNAARAA